MAKVPVAPLPDRVRPAVGTCRFNEPAIHIPIISDRSGSHRDRELLGESLDASI